VTTFLIITPIKPEIEQIQKKISNKAELADLVQIQPIDSKAIGIEKSRELIKFAQRKPMSGSQKLAVIFEAHKMTDEAQNALLKTLEEHPEFLDIVLVAKNEHGILTTVLSRCKKVAMESAIPKTSKKSTKKPINIKDLKTLKIGEQLAFAQKVSKMEKEEIIELLELWAIEEEKAGFYENADMLLKYSQDFEQLSLNGRLALEACFLKLSK
jgi:DNA polymerase-3 subunit delta'